jgi:hypothetical protein
MRYEDGLKFYDNLRKAKVITTPAVHADAAPPNQQNFEDAESVKAAVAEGVEAAKAILKENPQHRGALNFLRENEGKGK